jgi:glyoxylase-like metal-dependent hydrolase (beta-lactamase superfamily II)
MDGLHQIDTLLGGWERVTAGWLVGDGAPVLVETGSQTSVPVVRAALAGLGVGPGDLAGIVVTHVHLDHAGGVGDLARAFPQATVYVHPAGAPHLADPSRLVASAGRVYGELLDGLYGRLDPTPAERIVALDDGDEIAVGGGRALTVVHSPGHARHHLALHDSETGVLFAGDAVGVRLPDVGVLRPATPPPDFDLDLAVGSLRAFAARRPSALALAHFGVVAGDAADVLGEAEVALADWAAVAEGAWRAGADVATALTAAFGGDPSDALAALNGVHSNAAGLRRWLETRPPPTA